MPHADRAPIEIAAHRGTGEDFPQLGPLQSHRPSVPPENTLPAFEWGWARGTTCELDVYLTTDGEVIVIHDDGTKRTCNADLDVASSSLAQLRALDAGIVKGETWRGLKLPLLREVLDVMPDGKRLWSRAVGTHLHDLGPLPSHLTTVCPGLWGGVLTPMAYAHGRLFVPVVERCMRERSTDPAFPADLTRGNGVLVALSAKNGRQVWSRRLGSPTTGCATVAGDVVFVPTLAGRVFALAASDGRTLWQTQTRAGINGCPSVAGGLLLVGAGAPSDTAAASWGVDGPPASGARRRATTPAQSHRHCRRR